MDIRKRGSTSEMQVTSIRLEPELEEQLWEISGEQGYQTLIRDVLWQFVGQQMGAGFSLGVIAHRFSLLGIGFL